VKTLSRVGPADVLLADEEELAAQWCGRFAVKGHVPVLARDLLHAVLRSLRPNAAGGVDPAVTDAAYGLGAVRARQGNDTVTLVQDVLALRKVLWSHLAAAPTLEGDAALLLLVQAQLADVLDEVLRATVESYVEEAQLVLRTRATRDPLTGLLNRAAFEEALQREVAGADREAPPALLLVDLDGFKQVNDTLGHLTGDDVLVRVARLLEAGVRRADGRRTAGRRRVRGDPAPHDAGAGPRPGPPAARPRARRRGAPRRAGARGLQHRAGVAAGTAQRRGAGRRGRRRDVPRQARRRLGRRPLRVSGRTSRLSRRRTPATGTVGSLELLALRARAGDRRAAAHLRERMTPQVRELARALSADPRIAPVIARQALNDAVADDTRPYTWALVAAVQRRCAAGRTSTGRREERSAEERLIAAVGVLCDVQGHSHDAAAALLGEPVNRVAALHARGRSGLGVEGVRTHCRGWHLVSRLEELTPPEQEAGRQHLDACRPCADALADRAAARLRLKAALPVGGTLLGGGAVALLSAVGGGSAGWARRPSARRRCSAPPAPWP
jgi:hypothetical protein